MSDDLKYILNKNNIEITTDYVEQTLWSYGVDHKVTSLIEFQTAMVHLSYLIRDKNFYKNAKTKPYQIQSHDIEPVHDITNVMPLQKSSYERLEYLGDAILHAIFAEYIFKRYPSEDEGFMTKLRTKIENGDALSKLSYTIGLGKYVIISAYVDRNGGRITNKKIMEDVFEAFIGALYNDAGYELCRQFVCNLIEKEINMAQLLKEETNFKEVLLQYFHLKRWCDAKYIVIDVSGLENKKVYTVGLVCVENEGDEGKIIGIGKGNSKKDAQQMACKQYLSEIGLYNEHNEMYDTIEIMDD